MLDSLKRGPSEPPRRVLTGRSRWSQKGLTIGKGRNRIVIPDSELHLLKIASRSEVPRGKLYGMNFAIARPDSVATQQVVAMARVRVVAILATNGELQLESTPESVTTVRLEVRNDGLVELAEFSSGKLIEFLLLDPHIFGIAALSERASRRLQEEQMAQAAA
jgi:hypothetical protein